MTRTEFMQRLKKALDGLPATAITEITTDYQAHFDDAAAEGRSEAEVCEALGDPERLARELKAEIGLKRWEDTKTPGAALTAVFAVLGLGALDILVLLPILMGVAGALVGFFFGAIGVFIGGGVLFAAGPFAGIPGGIGAALLGGLGLMAGSVTVFCLTAVVTVWLVNGLVWFARLHYRILKPALDAQNA